MKTKKKKTSIVLDTYPTTAIVIEGNSSLIKGRSTIFTAEILVGGYTDEDNGIYIPPTHVFLPSLKLLVSDLEAAIANVEAKFEAQARLQS